MARTAVAKTANERLKTSFDGWMGASLIAATIAHLLVFQFFPEMTAGDWGTDSTEAVLPGLASTMTTRFSCSFSPKSSSRREPEYRVFDGATTSWGRCRWPRPMYWRDPGS